MALNWIAAGLSIAEIAKEIYKSVKNNKEKQTAKPPDFSPDGLIKRMTDIETSQLKQAELLSNMADQVKLLTNRLRLLMLICIGLGLLVVMFLIYRVFLK